MFELTRARAPGRSATNYEYAKPSAAPKENCPSGKAESAPIRLSLATRSLAAGAGMVSLYVGITDYDWFRLLFS
jgi:hypothetical protein